jgi:hypothetical protein
MPCDHTLIQKGVSRFLISAIWINRISILQTPESRNCDKGLVHAISSLILKPYDPSLWPDPKSFQVRRDFAYQNSRCDSPPFSRYSKLWKFHIISTVTNSSPTNGYDEVVISCFASFHNFYLQLPKSRFNETLICHHASYLNEQSWSFHDFVFHEFSRLHPLTFPLCKSRKY